MLDINLCNIFINTIKDCIAIYKVVDDGEDFEFIDFNKAAEELEKVTRDKLIGKKVTEIFPGVVELGLLDTFKKVYKDGVSVNHPLKFYEDERISGYRENTVYKLDNEHIVAVYSDITKEKQAEYQLQRTLAFLKSHQIALDESNIVTKSDLSGIITYVNSAFCKLTGYSAEESIGRPHSIIRHPDNPSTLYQDMWATIKSKKVWKGILQNRGKLCDYWVDLTILPILDDKDEIVEYIAVRHDITQVIQQQQKLDNIANTDSLTGQGSRYKLIKDIGESSSPALAILNIDKFSQINDLYGHLIGDKVIKQFSQRLWEVKSSKLMNIYHVSGDEFVILHKDITKDDFLEKLIQIKTKLDDIKIIIDKEDLSLSFTTGISFEQKEHILETADMALKIAKKENKSLVIYREEISLNKEYENNLKWTKKIKEAIETNSITPVYQPIINNKTGKIEKYESLVRIEDNDELISPYFFLEISKKTKQYTHITKVMIEKTFEKFKDINMMFSINITIEDILNDEIKAFIYTMLDSYKIGNRVIFEIVESESIEIFEQVHEFIKIIKSNGCKIAIDDFGTGYSNFEYLVKLEADYVKIDGSLIKNIDSNNTSFVVVKNIAQFSKDLGMKTIAEFVEDKAILKKVNEIGIDYSQGYYFGKPQKELITE
ncbi:MAG: EAL domain-containing protein [Arcobacter sp.]|uniref:EAL domain-containing protein n=1 Tax=Arcobacter sp. TaxID=1872629 RepID=UPI003B00267D